MSFLNHLKEKNEIPQNKPSFADVKKSEINLSEKEEKPEDLLRRANLKIKLVTPTSFGTQIDFAKTYEEEEITAVLKDFSIKIKGKSVFVIK